MNRHTKLLLAIAIIFGVGAPSEQVLYKPGYEYVYKVSNLFKSGIHQLKHQYAYNEFQYLLNVIPQDDETLLLKTESMTVFDEGDAFQPMGNHYNGKKSDNMPTLIRDQYQAPVICHYKNEKFDRLETNKGLPRPALNFKKYQCSLFQVGAFKRQHEQQESAPGLSRSQGQIMHFFVEEQQLQGDCYTEYQVQNLPRHLVASWDSSVRTVMRKYCPEGPYVQVIKTTNTSACSNDPSIHYGSPPSFKCPPGGNSCANIMQRGNTVNYIGCGDKSFVPFSIQARDTLAANLQLIDAEDASAKATMSMYLLEVNMASAPRPSHGEFSTVSQLYFRWPGAEYQKEDSALVKSPGLDKAPLTPYGSMLFSGISPPSRKTVIKQALTYIYEIPDMFDYSSSVIDSDAGNKLQHLIKLLRVLNYNELQQMQSSFRQQPKKIKAMLADALCMAGTNPAIKMVQEMIRSGQLKEDGHWTAMAPHILVHLYSYVTTPTEEMLQHILEFVQWTMSQDDDNHLEAIAIVNFADLLHKACVHPRMSHFMFPENIYEFSCNVHSKVVQKFYSDIKSRLNQHLKTGDDEESTLKVLKYLMALNRLGHPDTLKDMIPILEGKVTERPLIRTEAVYSLIRLALSTNRAAVAYVLDALIMDECEHPDVRIAAINILMYSDADTVVLQNLALKSYQGLNHKVHCYLQSLMQSLKDVRDPHHQYLRKKAMGVYPLIKDIECGLADSLAYVHSDYIYELELGYFVEMSTHASRTSAFPRNIFLMYNLQPGMLKSFVPYQFSSWFDTLRGIKEHFQSTFQQSSEGTPSGHQQEQSANMEKIKSALHLLERPTSIFSTFFASAQSDNSKSKHFTLAGDWYQKIGSYWQNTLRDVMDRGYFMHWRSAWYSEEHTLAYPTAMGAVAMANFEFPSVLKIKGGLNAKTKPDMRRGPFVVPDQVNITAFVDASYYWQLYGSIGFFVPSTKKHVAASVAKQVMYNAQGLAEISWDRAQQVVTASYSLFPHIDEEVTIFHAQQKPKTMSASLNRLSPPEVSGSLIVVNEELPEVVEEYGKHAFGINTKVNYTLDSMDTTQSLWAAVMEANTPTGWYLAPWAIPTVGYGSIHASIDIPGSEASSVTMAMAYNSEQKTADKTTKAQKLFTYMYNKEDGWDSSESAESQSSESTESSDISQGTYRLYSNYLPKAYYMMLPMQYNVQVESQDTPKRTPGKIWAVDDQKSSHEHADHDAHPSHENDESHEHADHDAHPSHENDESHEHTDHDTHPSHEDNQSHEHTDHDTHPSHEDSQSHEHADHDAHPSHENDESHEHADHDTHQSHESHGRRQKRQMPIPASYYQKMQPRKQMYYSTTPDYFSSFGSFGSFESTESTTLHDLYPPLEIDNSPESRRPVVAQTITVRPIVQPNTRHLELASKRAHKLITSGDVCSIAVTFATSNKERVKQRHYEAAVGIAVDHQPTGAGLSAWLHRKCEKEDHDEPWSASLDIGSDFPVPPVLQHKLAQRANTYSQSSLKFSLRQGTSLETDIYINGTFKRSSDQEDYAHSSPETKYCEMKAYETPEACLEAADQALTLNHYEFAMNYDGQIPDWLANATTHVATAMISHAYDYVAVNPTSNNRDLDENEVLVHVHYIPGKDNRMSAEIKLHQGTVTIKSPHAYVGPMKLGTHMMTQLANGIMADQYTPYCHLEKGRVSTLDDFTFMYDEQRIGTCPIVVAMDCSMYSKFAILLKQHMTQYKEMMAYISGHNVEIKIQDGDYRPMLYVDGKKVDVKDDKRHIEIEKSMYGDETVFVATRTADGQLQLQWQKDPQGLEVTTDGMRYRIAVPNAFRNLTCGLCGDFNGEQTADMKSPKDCVLDDPNVLAASFAVSDNKCQAPDEMYLKLLAEQDDECESNCNRGTPVDTHHYKETPTSAHRPPTAGSHEDSGSKSEEECKPVGQKREINIGGMKCKSSKIRTCPKGCAPVKQRFDQVTFKCPKGKTVSQTVNVDLACTRR